MLKVSFFCVNARLILISNKFEMSSLSFFLSYHVKDKSTASTSNWAIDLHKRAIWLWNFDQRCHIQCGNENGKLIYSPRRPGQLIEHWVGFTFVSGWSSGLLLLRFERHPLNWRLHSHVLHSHLWQLDWFYKQLLSPLLVFFTLTHWMNLEAFLSKLTTLIDQ